MDKYNIKKKRNNNIKSTFRAYVNPAIVQINESWDKSLKTSERLTNMQAYDIIKNVLNKIEFYILNVNEMLCLNMICSVILLFIETFFK